MRPRTALGLAVAAGFIGFLTRATVATQCPMRELGPCAKVHALLMRTRASEPQPPVLLALVAPMRGHAPSGGGTEVGRRLARVEGGR